MGFSISLLSSAGSYYTYDVVPPYLVYGEYLGLSTSSFVPGVSPSRCAISDTFFYNTSPRTLALPSGKGMLTR